MTEAAASTWSEWRTPDTCQCLISVILCLMVWLWIHSTAFASSGAYSHSKWSSQNHRWNTQIITTAQQSFRKPLKFWLSDKKKGGSPKELTQHSHSTALFFSIDSLTSSTHISFIHWSPHKTSSSGHTSHDACGDSLVRALLNQLSNIKYSLYFPSTPSMSPPHKATTPL